MKKGTILWWFGIAANIPYGWHMCDGTLGTPDLRNKWLIGAGSTYNPGDTGGNQDHNHDFTTNGHIHSLAYTPQNITWDGVCYRTTDNKNDTGTTVTRDNYPPYRSWYYIIKLVPSRHNG